mmetsp:Transcript_37131/g.35812  ORF Transcript_37131/g.35812 Transcript_37131/m.35812 type:complete len:109 (+) Transcript_37131:529-855(+)
MKKRDKKLNEKINLHKMEYQGLQFNSANNGKALSRILKQPKESIDQGNYNIRGAELPSISETLCPILKDMDPQQEIEDQYKHRHDQVFSWRFLKTISYVDLINFHGPA